MPKQSFIHLTDRIRKIILASWILVLVLFITSLLLWAQWRVSHFSQQLVQAAARIDLVLTKAKSDTSTPWTYNATLPATPETIDFNNNRRNSISTNVLQTPLFESLKSLPVNSELLYFSRLENPFNALMLYARRNLDSLELSEQRINFQAIINELGPFDLVFHQQQILSHSNNQSIEPVANCNGLSFSRLVPIYCHQTDLGNGYTLILEKSLAGSMVMLFPITLIGVFLVVLIVRLSSISKNWLSSAREELYGFNSFFKKLNNTIDQSDKNTDTWLTQAKELLTRKPIQSLRYSESKQVYQLLDGLINKQQQLAKTLQSSRIDYDLLSDLSHTGLLFFDEHGIASATNESLCAITGHSREKLLQLDWYDLLDNHDQTLFFRHWQNALNKGKEFELKVHIMRADGEKRYCKINIVIQPEQSQYNRVVAVFFDITEPTRIQTQLNNSERLWKFALEGNDQGIWEWDVETDEMFLSQKWRQMLGYQDIKLSNTIQQWYKLIHPDDIEPTKAAINNLLEKISNHMECEHRLQTSDGGYIWFFVRAMVMEQDTFGRPRKIIGVHTDISEQKSQQEQIHHLAYHDTLTDLPNRMFLQEEVKLRLSIMKRYQHHGALLFLDLDRFKVVNDTMGHHKGDLLLQKVAERISACIRSGDLLARLGGDEFAILLGQQTDNRHEIANHAHLLAEKILDTVSGVFDLGSKHVTTGASIGITIFPGDGEDFDELLRHADAAMYKAKKQGRNCFQYYERSLEDEIQKHMQLENELRAAISNKELVVYFQPKVCLEKGMVHGAEALVRWQKPDGQLVSPLDFIPIAEETGLIIPLGDWVLLDVLEKMSQWIQLPQFQSFQRVAVNVSAKQFQDQQFIYRLKLLLNKHSNLAHRLELEITESAFIHNLEDTILRMNELKKLGITFALDDFGTGYSSLAFLKQLPVDVLKIDRAFINDIETDEGDAALVKATISMAKALDLKVVAEGVENLIQMNFLQRNGCEYFQGYLFSPPVSADQFIDMVGRRLDTGTK